MSEELEEEDEPLEEETRTFHTNIPKGDSDELKITNPNDLASLPSLSKETQKDKLRAPLLHKIIASKNLKTPKRRRILR
jgi:hypothetical protein